MDFHFHINRRTFLNQTTLGIGSLALTSQLLAATQSSGSRWPGAIKPRFPQKAKRIIFLCMAGGPSHLETLDYKPNLAAMDGKPMPKSITEGQPIAQLQGKELKCLGPQREFKRYGKSGQMMADVFPNIGKHADDLAIINSLQTRQINHDPAHTYMNTGTQISGRPCMGSWINYGLGSESENLPGFVVLTSVGGGQSQPIASRQWSSGFLPSRFQGVQFHSSGDPVLYVGNPEGVNQNDQKAAVDAVNSLNRIRNDDVHDPEIATRIAQYEMAFKMQSSVPELTDLSGEPKHILDLYGARPGDGSFSSNCLLARRLAERGVRFIQLYHRGWDHHGNVKGGVEATAKLVDQGTGALLEDLKQRDMLKDTLVIWGGEFGRTPMSQGGGRTPGRDHHIKGFSIWLAGGGIKGGLRHGMTDDFGYNAIEDIVQVRDLHATMLRLLGIDHERFTFKFQGLDMRLTGVEEAHPVKELIA